MRPTLILAAVLVGGPAMAAPEVPVAPHIARDFHAAVPKTSGNGKATVWRVAGKEEGAKNAFFAVLELNPGAKVPVHRDATEEYLYIINGTGEITIDGTRTAVAPGFAIFMPAEAQVSFVVTSTEVVRAVQFFAGQGPEEKYEKWVSEPVK